MRIGIDARFLTHPQVGGFKTYTENLVYGLAKVDADNEYFLYLDRPPTNETLLPARPNFVPAVVPMRLPLIGMPIREQVQLVRRARRDRVDVIHAPCLTAPLGAHCPLVLTVHDMIWFDPERYSAGHHAWTIRRRLMELYQRSVALKASAGATAIVTVSETSKAGIVDGLGVDAHRVFVTYEAAHPTFRRLDASNEDQSVRARFGLPPRFVLALGSADPRKNVPALVEAYSGLSATLRDEYGLVIVWTHSLFAMDLADRVARLGLTHRVRFLEHVPTPDLVGLYNAARVFVHPSVQEGFGLPLLEAMACGTPVVAVNNSSVPEVTGGAALLAAGPDPDSLARCMTQVLEDPSLSATLSALGLERAACFSWERCARETIAVYARAARGDVGLASTHLLATAAGRRDR